MDDLYIIMASVAGLVFFYSLIAKRVDNSLISGPMIFTAVGFLCGSWGLGIFGEHTSSHDLRLLADLTLALVLFSDAANANLAVLKKHVQVPLRMLLAGLPMIILLGFAAAVFIFESLTLYEAAILATMLAATDAALGKAVVTDKKIPAEIREGLNAESGFNDGLCVPILLLLIALSLNQAGGEQQEISAMLLVAEELGIGLIVGLGFAFIGAHLLRYAQNNGGLSEVWTQTSVAALAISSFAVAQHIHGSGYIASFSGGLLFGYLAKDNTHKLVMGAEVASEVLALSTWVLFGAVVIVGLLDYMTWNVFIYALLSLTVIRMLPIYISFIGSNIDLKSRLFMGWFGPRGLASLVFVIIVLDTEIAGAKMIALVVITTVFLSLILHAITAKPLTQWLIKSK